jgi:hypothetical protein
MDDSRFEKRAVELLALRALSGERVSLLLGRRRFTLTVDPVFRLEDGCDGFLYLCMGLSSLRQRLDALADGGQASEVPVSELGGAQGPH